MNYDNLPFRESRKENLVRRYGNLWDLPKFDYPRKSNKGDYTWVIADRLIQVNLGVNVNKVYSEFCKKTTEPWSQRKDFFDMFETEHSRRYRPEKYIVDENNLIQLNPKVKKPKRTYKLRSDEFHLRTGEEYEILTFYSNQAPLYRRLLREQQVRLRYKKYKMTEEEFRYWLNYDKKLDR